MPNIKKKSQFISKKKKIVSASSSSSSSDSDSVSESEYNPSSSQTSYSTEEDDEKSVYTECTSSNEGNDKEGDNEEKFDHKKFKKTVEKIFPSKYSKDRAKEHGKKNKHDASYSTSDDDYPSNYDSDEEDDEEEERKRKRKTKKQIAKKSKARTNRRKHRKEVNDSDESSDSDYDTADEEIEEKRQFMIYIGGSDDDTYDESEVESLTEDTAEEFDSDAEKTFMGDAYEAIVNNDQSSPKNKKKSTKRDTKQSAKKDHKKKNAEEDKTPIPTNVENEYKEMLDVKKMLLEQLKKRPKNKFLQSSLNECNANIKKLTRKARHENTNAYYKMITNDKRQANEIDYFKHRLSNKEQQNIMADLKKINREIYSEKPYRLTLLQSSIPSKFKAVAMQRLNMLKSMDPGDHEYYKIKNWVDAFMRIPFGVYRNINVRITDGIDVCNDFMENAKRTLDQCVYGLNDAKSQIMQMLGQWIVNPNSVGTSIAIHGPPGTGKTSIVKDGISKILGREFAFIALGGCGDGSFLEGHSYTYEGSTWGKIVQILMECKSMNPIIYFDELDKVSDTARGQENIGILTHLTDTTQNTEFHDKYFSEVSLDLSKCLFIFSYNDETMVNPILKDRMYRIQTKGYDTKEKMTIARDYLLPKIREQVCFTSDEIIIPDDTLQYIITTPYLTKSESGVRNLKRCLEIIYTKLNLYRLVKPGNEMFEKDLGIKVEFPFTVKKNHVDVFIKNNETINPSVLAMYL
jgi:ATP-dependent Lon protease